MPVDVSCCIKEDLVLEGVHYRGGRDICVVCFLNRENQEQVPEFIKLWGEMLSKRGVGLVYGCDRISNTEMDCWFDMVLSLGYSNLLILGYDYGCQRCLMYLSSSVRTDVIGLILVSPSVLHLDLDLLETVVVPLFVFSGSYEEADYLEMEKMEAQAVNCPKFNSTLIMGSFHEYLGHEMVTSVILLDYIERCLLNEYE